MELIFGRVHIPTALIRTALRNCAISLVAALLGTISLRALPENGTPAPPLSSARILQAPPGARADSASLRGKVVVLEFWATWCPPCVANIPHLNRLVESLDPAKFQFISIDDEDPKVVQAFLTRRKVAGWVGVDTSGSVFAWYGVKSRPTTVIVDGKGRVVAATELDSLNATDLRAVAEGKAVAFKPAMKVSSSSSATASDAATQPLFAISIGRAAPDARLSMVRHPPTGTDFLGADADFLITEAFSPGAYRLVLTCSLPEGRYDIRTNFVDVPDPVISSAVQQAVLAGLHLQVQPKTVTRNAYILRAAGTGTQLLTPTASTGRTIRGYWNGTLRIMNGTMNLKTAVA